MGLLDLLLGKENPVAQWSGRNSNLLTGLGTSLLSDGMNFQPAQAGSVLDRQAAQQKDADAKLAADINATKTWLQQKYPQYADLPPSEGFKLAMEAEKAKYGGDSGSPESFFGNPIYTTDAEGNMHVNQIGNRGSLNPLALPEGQTLASPTKTINTETEQIVTDMFGNVISRIPINNQQAARDTATGTGLGKADAENIVAADSLASKMPGLQTVVAQLDELGKKATYSIAGQAWDESVKQVGGTPSEAAVARASYIAMVDNQVLPLLRDTFGAAFTMKEGETLRATLGDPNKHPAEKKAVLDAFIAQKTRDLQAMESRIPGGGGSDPDVESILSGLGL